VLEYLNGIAKDKGNLKIALGNQEGPSPPAQGIFKNKRTSDLIANFTGAGGKKNKTKRSKPKKNRTKQKKTKSKRSTGKKKKMRKTKKQGINKH
jgi:hypothetical protein